MKSPEGKIVILLYNFHDDNASLARTISPSPLPLINLPLPSISLANPKFPFNQSSTPENFHLSDAGNFPSIRR
ncbi:hypothetical protein L1887_17934 [Cichorium endivia]|nr:hypothetical protein L1887_17934 [Cichorium endivia]